MHDPIPAVVFLLWFTVLVALIMPLAAANCIAAESIRNTKLDTDPASCCYTFANTHNSIVGEWEIFLTNRAADIRLTQPLQPIRDGIPESLRHISDPRACGVSRVHLYDHQNQRWIEMDTQTWQPFYIDDDAFLHFRAPDTKDLAKLMIIDSTLLRLDLVCMPANTTIVTRSCVLSTFVFAWSRSEHSEVVHHTESRDEDRIPVPERVLHAKQHECVQMMDRENDCVVQADLEASAAFAVDRVAAAAAMSPADNRPMRTSRVLRSSNAINDPLVVVYSVTLTLKQTPDVVVLAETAADAATPDAATEAAARQLIVSSRFMYCANCETATTAEPGYLVFCDASVADWGATPPLVLAISDTFRMAAKSSAYSYYHALWDDGGICILNMTKSGSTIGFSQCEFYLRNAAGLFERYILASAAVSPIMMFHNNDQTIMSSDTSMGICSAQLNILRSMSATKTSAAQQRQQTRTDSSYAQTPLSRTAHAHVVQ